MKVPCNKGEVTRQNYLSLGGFGLIVVGIVVVVLSVIGLDDPLDFFTLTNISMWVFIVIVVSSVTVFYYTGKRADALQEMMDAGTCTITS